MEIKLLCRNCGKFFEVNSGNKKQTCSSDCRWEFRKKMDMIYYETKICPICNNEFTAKTKEHKKYCSYKCSGEAKHQIATETRTCHQCGNKFNERKKYERKFCSEKCRLNWQSKSENIEKRIYESKRVLLKNHGVDSVFKLKTFQEKYRNNEFNLVSIKKAALALTEKRNNKLIKRFNDIGYKILEFNGDKMKIRHPDGHEFENNRKLLVNRLNHNTEISTQLLPISASKSTLELKTVNFLDELNVNYITNNRKLLSGNEIDILVDKIGIELNGLHWHCEYYLDKEYHLRKLDACNKIGIELLQFYEDEITEKFDIVKSIISAKLNLIKNVIYVRKCEIRVVNVKEAIIFLNKNHLEENVKSKYQYGLYFEDELVSLMTFGNKRRLLKNMSNDNEYEMLRFCDKLDFSVVGGASKLLKHFINIHKPENITTYTNRRYVNENLYIQLGFTEINKTPPNYWYVVNKQRKHKSLYRKDVLVKEGYNCDETVHQIMLNRKLPRIYDCGNIKYKLNLIKKPSII